MVVYRKLFIVKLAENIFQVFYFHIQNLFGLLLLFNYLIILSTKMCID